MVLPTINHRRVGLLAGICWLDQKSKSPLFPGGGGEVALVLLCWSTASSHISESPSTQTSVKKNNLSCFPISGQNR